MRCRPVAAGLMIVTSLACANVARAEVTIVLSINLTGLDAGARFVQPSCVGFSAETGRPVIASGGLPFQPVTGGQFVQTVRISMRRTEAAGGPVTEYACGVSVWGQRRDGVAYTFNDRQGTIASVFLGRGVSARAGPRARRGRRIAGCSGGHYHRITPARPRERKGTASNTRRTRVG